MTHTSFEARAGGGHAHPINHAKVSLDLKCRLPPSRAEHTRFCRARLFRKAPKASAVIKGFISARHKTGELTSITQGEITTDNQQRECLLPQRMVASHDLVYFPLSGAGTPREVTAVA